MLFFISTPFVKSFTKNFQGDTSYRFNFPYYIKIRYAIHARNHATAVL